ncbi:MAG: hypothetical protein MI924_25685 [Chloroflexales bacterium]|nr:hypothetical protein [Chloroflexales bacterium]
MDIIDNDGGMVHFCDPNIPQVITLLAWLLSGELVDMIVQASIIEVWDSDTLT